MLTIDVAVLWIHLFTSTVFVGGSFFIWLVVWPASYGITDDEAERTKIVGKIAKRFALFTHISVVILALSGTYLAAPTLLTGSVSGPERAVLLVKIGLVVAMIALMYANNIYHGRKIMRLAAEGKLDEVRKVRRLTHLASYITLALMLAITVLGAILVSY